MAPSHRASKYVVSKNSGKPRLSYASNALSQSKIGVKGREPITDDLAFVFQAETHLVPTSLRLANGLKSVVRNNGRPIDRQSSNGDSSKDGELFAGQAFFGLSSHKYGTITFGRQWSLMLDNIVVYDPLVASHAFSIVGYQGAAQAGAATEDARLDRSLKYTLKLGQARFVGMFQFGDEQLPAVRAYGADVGYDLGGLSVDATYMHVNDSIAAAALTPDQFAVLPHNSLAASVSDNDAFGIFAKYRVSNWTVFAGLETIEYQKPDHLLTAGYRTVGGFLLSTINNNAYPRHKWLTYSWVGARYAATSRLALTAAYYRVDQNSYALESCADESSPLCSGHLNALTLVADYRLTRRVDVYSGAMYSHVDHGLASGFLHQSSVDPTVGVRLSF
jgi:predicted porin